MSQGLRCRGEDMCRAALPAIAALNRSCFRYCTLQAKERLQNVSSVNSIQYSNHYTSGNEICIMSESHVNMETKYFVIICGIFQSNYLSCSLTLKDKYTLRVFENKVLRKIFRPKRNEVKGNGEDSTTRSFTSCTYIQPDFNYHSTICLERLLKTTKNRILLGCATEISYVASSCLNGVIR